MREIVSRPGEIGPSYFDSISMYHKLWSWAEVPWKPVPWFLRVSYLLYGVGPVECHFHLGTCRPFILSSTLTHIRSYCLRWDRKGTASEKASWVSSGGSSSQAGRWWDDTSESGRSDSPHRSLGPRHSHLASLATFSLPTRISPLFPIIIDHLEMARPWKITYSKSLLTT